MFTIQAKNQHLDLRGSIKVWIFLVLSLLISLLIAFLSQTWWIPIGLFAISLSTTVLLMQSPQQTVVQITDKNISFNDHTLNWLDCLGWAAVNLNDSMEIVILTRKLPHVFYYFYLLPESQDIKPLLQELSKYIPYNENIPKQNLFHLVFRLFGLK